MVRIDLGCIRANVAGIAASTGVDVYPVVKANAYGLGIVELTGAIADLAAAWCVFSLDEAIAGDLWRRTGRPSFALGPPACLDPRVWMEHHVRPAVSNLAQAKALAAARPVLCVDTGMQRFACPGEEVAAILDETGIDEAFTHATRMEHVQQLRQIVGDRRVRLHAAASSLLGQPEAWLAAVRPGLAMYQSAVRMTAPLVETHASRGPAGYTGFRADRHGVILCGYSQGLSKGPCLVNGQRRQILEVGMQSAYVELGAEDRVGDEVVLLGDELDGHQVAAAWGVTPHQVLTRLSAAGQRHYV